MRAFALLLLFAGCALAQGYWLDTDLAGGERSYGFLPLNGTEVLHGSLLMNTSAGFTFEGWILYQPVSGPYAVWVELDTGNFTALETCGSGRDPNNTYAFVIYVDVSTAKVVVQLVACLIGQNSTLVLTLESLQPLPLGFWTHVSMSFAAGSFWDLYVNGTLENFLAVPTWNVSGTPMLTTGNLTLFDKIGGVDEIRWWDYPRGPSETRRDYCTRLNGANSNILAMWDFDIGPNETNIIYDRSPYGNELYNHPPIPVGAFIVGEPPLCGSMNESQVVTGLVILLLGIYVAGIATVCFFGFLSCKSGPGSHARLRD